MKNKSIWGVVIILIIVAIGLYQNRDTDKNTVKIGVILPLSDIFASFGEEALAGVKSITDQYPNIELVIEDEKCAPAPAVGAFQKLVEVDNVNFILGPGCGSPQEAIAPLVKEKDVLNMLASAATRNLHDVGGGKIYNSQYSLQQESKFVAEKMYELGHKKVILLSYNNAFSKTHTDSFKENFKGEIVADVVVPDNTTDLSTEIIKLKNISADAIFSTDGAFFFAQGIDKLKQYGINLPVFSQYVVEFPSIKPLAEGVIYSFPGDIGNNGATYELAKISTEILVKNINKCDGDYDCVVKEFEKSNEFNEYGIRNQEIILKQIKNGEAIKYE
jgi:branched-chain amino acid transport system substrate-binding protein